MLRCQGKETMPLLINKDIDSYYVPCSCPPVKEMKIPKKNKKLGHRVVYKVDAGELEDALKALKFYLNERYTPHPCTHGFIIGRSIVSNAASHLNKRYVLNIDIKDFFESIPFTSIENTFMSMGFNMSISHTLALISTYEGKLVAGFPTSPTIANMVCHNMDAKINDYCIQNDLTYTRYADDITVSGNIDPCAEISAIIESFGFTLNADKTRLQKQGRSMYVTGLTVCDDRYPRVPRRFKRKIRQTLHCMETYGVESHVRRKYNQAYFQYEDGYKELRWLRGWIDFVKSIEPELAKKYYEQYYAIKEDYRKRVAAEYLSELET